MKVLAVILAGGRGSRLDILSENRVKPSVPFAGKYRIIDFTLSNCANSNIYDIAILTQYLPFSLNDHIGSGKPWDMDRRDTKVTLLQPHSSWYNGTADAVRKNIHYIEQVNPDIVLILSGDHIYKMDYRKMIQSHVDKGALLTVGCNVIEPKDAHRFGMMATDDDLKVTHFVEKPKQTDLTLASMGIYIFSVDVLEKLLNEATKEENDFGHHLIPKAIRENYEVSVYRFGDYWKDVGTVQSLYEANMDLLDNPDFLGLNISNDLPIYSKSLNLNPHVILSKGHVLNSVIADGCLINGCVNHSTVAYQTIVEAGSCITDCVIFPRVTIGYHASLKHVIVNEDVSIPDNYICHPNTLTLITKKNLMEVGVINA